MVYTKQVIHKALLLTPIPLLICTAVAFMVTNHEYSLNSIFVILVGHVIIYLMYCVLTLPFSVLLSVFFNSFQYLNLLTIFLGVLMIATPFLILLGWFHTGKIPEAWWEMYWNISVILLTLIITLSYFFILKWLQRKSLSLNEHNSI